MVPGTELRSPGSHNQCFTCQVLTATSQILHESLCPLYKHILKTPLFLDPWKRFLEVRSKLLLFCFPSLIYPCLELLWAVKTWTKSHPGKDHCCLTQAPKLTSACSSGSLPMILKSHVFSLFFKWAAAILGPLRGGGYSYLESFTIVWPTMQNSLPLRLLPGSRHSSLSQPNWRWTALWGCPASTLVLSLSHQPSCLFCRICHHPD